MSGWSGSNLSWKLKKNPYYWDKKNVKLDGDYLLHPIQPG